MEANELPVIKLKFDALLEAELTGSKRVATDIKRIDAKKFIYTVQLGDPEVKDEAK